MAVRRVGTKDREVHAEHIRDCYAEGYLNDEDLGKRVAKAYEAVTVHDLAELTADLPSPVELHGTPQAPHRLRKALAGFPDLVEEHPVGTLLPLMVFSALWAITPSVVIGTHNLYAVVPFQVFGIFSLVTGTVGFFASLIVMAVETT